MATTFAVSDVELPTKPELVEYDLLTGFRKNAGEDGVEDCNSNSKNVRYSYFNAFAAAFHTAYGQHRPLVLSPDDVALTISQAFAIHVEQNAEKLRTLFVN